MPELAADATYRNEMSALMAPRMSDGDEETLGEATPIRNSRIYRQRKDKKFFDDNPLHTMVLVDQFDEKLIDNVI